jgi:predicted dehydrogenase
MSLRWGILGPGRIAPRLVRGIGRSGRSELVAVAGRDAGRAEAFAARHAIPRSFGLYEALLADPDVDVVYVSLPNHLHAEWTVRALEAGKHVLCEKPLALTVAEVDRISAAADGAGRIAVEAFMYLHHPQILRALELAASGALGRLEVVSGTFSFLLSQADDPRVDPSMGGGSLWDVGCYPVSLARRIAGRNQTPSRRSPASTSTESTGRSSDSSTSRAACSPSSTVVSRPPIASASRSSATRDASSSIARSCRNRTDRRRP